MVQTLKPEIRERILSVATEAFMRVGYRSSRLQDIAHAANVATGNLYRYYNDKDHLFDAIVSRDVAAQLLRLLRSRVRELGSAADWTTMTAAGSTNADALLNFFIEQRTPVLIILSGAEGSALGHVRQLVVRELTRLAASYLSQHQPNVLVPPTVLVQIFKSTADMIVAILRESANEEAIRSAFAAFWRYQLSGLEALLHCPQADSR